LNCHKNPAVCPGKQTAQQVINDIIANDSESFNVDESLNQQDYSHQTENHESSEREQQRSNKNNNRLIHS